MLGISEQKVQAELQLTSYYALYFLMRKYFIMLLNPAANSPVEQWNIVQCAYKKLEIKCANFSQ